MELNKFLNYNKNHRENTEKLNKFFTDDIVNVLDYVRNFNTRIKIKI
jgi:hypothetical protein